MKSLPGEEWRLVPDSNDVYVSNLGRLKRNNKLVPTQLNKDKYLQASFGPILKRKLVHRIVAQVWVDNPNPEDYRIVDHIDGCKTNNAASNLRWCNVQMNTQYYYDLNEKSKPIRSGYIMMIKNDTQEGYLYNTITDASKALNIGSQQISNMLRYPGVRAYGGYTAVRLVSLDNIIYHNLEDGTAISGNSFENGNWAEIHKDGITLRISDNRDEDRRMKQVELREIITRLLDQTGIKFKRKYTRKVEKVSNDEQN